MPLRMDAPIERADGVIPHNVLCRAVQTQGCVQQSHHVENVRRVREIHVRSRAERPTYRRGTGDAAAAAVAESLTCLTSSTGSADCCHRHSAHHLHRQF